MPKKIQPSKFMWDYMDDDFYLYGFLRSCHDREYSSFDKWEDGQFVEDDDLFFSLCDILSHFEEENSDNQP